MAESPVVDSMVAVDGVRLHFQVIEGESPIILLESGGGDDLSSWKGLPMDIARETGATVVSYSRPGFGRSELPEGPCDMKEEAGWLWKGLVKLGYDRDLILVGLSYGGWMIRLEANDNPEAVRGIVFIDPFSAEFVDILGVEYLDNHPMAGKLPFDTSDLSKLSKHQRALVRMSGGGLSPKMKIMRETRVPEGVPVVIIRSGLPFWPKSEEQEAWYMAIKQMTNSIDGAVLMVAEESGHLIHFRQPELIIEAIKKVMDKL